MTLYELYDHLDEVEILGATDEIMDFFAQPMSEKDALEAGDLFVEFISTQQRLRKFELLETLHANLKAHNPGFLSNEGVYLLGVLALRAAYLRMPEKIRDYVAEIEDYLEHIDEYFDVIEALGFAGYGPAIKEVLGPVILDLSETPGFFGNPELELSMILIDQHMEESYRAFLGTGRPIDWKEIKTYVASLGLNTDDPIMKMRAAALTISWEDEPDFAGPKVPKVAEDVFFKMRMYFQKWMLEKKVPFFSSNHIWVLFSPLFQIKSGITWKKSLHFSEDALEERLKESLSFMTEGLRDTVLIAEGGSYVVEFLFEKGLIEEKARDQYQASLHDKRMALYGGVRGELWKYFYIRDWLPAHPSLKETHEDLVHQHMQSYDTVYEPSISEFLDDDFGMEPSILDGMLDMLEDDLLLEDELTPDTEEEITWESLGPPEKPYKKQAWEQLGRNERITVEYEDGSVLENVKLKKVIEDLELGKCSLIEPNSPA
ncbi:MAG: hypothetical protein AAFQ98_10880 [Bacteroidota bacterium]